MSGAQAIVAAAAVLVCVFVLASCDTAPGTAGGRAATSKRLRGYGTVTTSFREVTGAKGPARVWTFAAESPGKASVVVGKLLADITLSPGVRRETVQVGDVDYPLVSVDGGACYAGFAVGDTGYVVSAGTEARVREALASPSELGIDRTAGVVTKLEYPQFLDRFDRYGWGFYAYLGPESTPPDQDPIEDLEFCAKHNFRVEMTPQPANHADSFSMCSWESMNWKTTEARRLGVPVAARLYCGGGLNILPVRKELSEFHQQPLPWCDSGWYGCSLEYRSAPQQSWYNEYAQLYMARQTQDQIRGMLKIAPEIGSWMLPYGELSNPEWVEFHGDRSPAAVESWRETLRARHGLSLADVSRMYRSRKPFASWDEVPVPESMFFGRDGMVKSLDDDWYVRPVREEGQGIEEKWWDADVRAGGWEKVDVPGDTRVHKYFRVPKWFVRNFDLVEGELPEGKIFLYSFASALNPDPRRKTLVYLNGELVGETGRWGGWDVTSRLRTGGNRLAIRPATEFMGRTFLSVEPPSLYPHWEADRNRLLRIFVDWATLVGKHRSAEVVLSGMREADPDRPIKIMAMPFSVLDLAERYGAWGHFTGEGNWFFPWFKRYGFVYGVPGTSEGGGPSNTVAELQMLYQRVFLEGLNGHDQVFVVQHITRNPPLKEWWEKHIAMLKQVGRYDISGPQVVIYRPDVFAMKDVPVPLPEGTSFDPLQQVWDWDIGRGTLQSIGHSYVYADDRAVRERRIDGYRVMMDCGTEVIEPESVEAIGDWVERGGTFITWPFTGRSLPDEADTWPISRLTGCKVSRLRTPGEGSVTVERDQSLFTELAGKTFPDAGYSKDWQDFEHNLLSTEFEPGPDCEVVARFENGAPAIVLRTLGKGRVVALGSAFFRGSHDTVGIWWPEEREPVFFRDLLNGLGLRSVNTTSDLRVWPQRYRTNNGLDEVVVVCNFADGDRTVSLDVALERPPAKVYRVAMNSVDEVTDFAFQDGTLRLADVRIPKGEVHVYYLRAHDPADAVEHWWAYQRKMWKPTDKSVKVDLAPISHGHWVDPTLDLKRDWRWTQEAQEGVDWTRDGFDDGAWKRWDLDVFNAVGADPKRSLFARKTFSVDPAWLADGGKTRLTFTNNGWTPRLAICDGHYRVYLNGKEIPRVLYTFVDNLREKDNCLAIEFLPVGGRYIGAEGAIYMTHERPYVDTLDLAGEWTGTLSGKPVTFRLPGKASCVDPTRRVLIPADWKEKYVVTYHAQGENACCLGVIVNNRSPIRTCHHCGGEVELDITDFLEFGRENLISPMYALGAYVGKCGEPIDWDLSKIELRLYPRDENRGP